MRIISFKNKIFDVLESLLVTNYKVAKKEVTSLKFLKILDNTDHLSRNTVLKLAEYFRNLVISVVLALLALLVYAINKNILSQFGFIFNLLPLFLFIFLILFCYNYLVLFISYLFKFIYLHFLKKSLKIRRLHDVLSFIKKLRIRLLILMIVTAYIINFLIIRMIQNESNSKIIESFINNPFIEYNLNCKLNGEVWVFWTIFAVVSLASCLSLFFVLKSQNIFELEDMESENRLILGFLAIVTFIIGVDIDKVRSIGIFLLILIIQTSSFDYYHSYLISKKRKKAQEIFQEQLLLEKPRYEELKRCYYHGGEKYKEKLLSTEKFLQLIKKREIYNINYKRRSLRSRRRK
ncbi:beta-carotene 15,15'-monooxygenase [Streptococcus sanguinis]|jgi:hypothetical protein|uniref:hypothetical protein n=1 Tax=Streptococcus sanguinis TaxID=1305 RepID=UPI000204C445|nr:hypothetical protein [Streptococcus sanguinis]EGF21625.1 hypothetical protein HMPREF9395_1152 [Streptococcus sanguinis SK1058]MCY7032270.1 beta-carotene 15,15'-monooxygenase [Streptococcus sanguinis]